MDNLSVNEKGESTKKGKTSKTLKPRLGDYPSLTVDPLYKEHFLFYGFYINDDQIMKYVIADGMAALTNLPAGLSCVGFFRTSRSLLATNTWS